MKNIIKKVFTTNTLIAITATFLIVFVSSCATKVNFLQSSVVPAAEGTVKVKKDNNSNYAISISLSNLAEPERLQPAKSMYVVWMETAQDGTKNLGQINSSTGLLSGKLKGSFETVSPFKPTRVYITAENDPGITYTDSQVVLSTNAF